MSQCNCLFDRNSFHIYIHIYIYVCVCAFFFLTHTHGHLIVNLILFCHCVFEALSNKQKNSIVLRLLNL